MLVSPRVEYQRRRAAETSRMKYGRLVYLPVSLLQGSTPYQHPPTHGLFTVDGAHPAGATALKLKASNINGRFLPGDRLLADPEVLVGVETKAIGPTVTLPLAAPLPVALADGTEIHPRWAGTILTSGPVVSDARRLVDSVMTITGMELATVPAIDFPQPPKPQDLLLLDGRRRPVVGFTPKRVEGVPVFYDLQIAS